MADIFVTSVDANSFVRGAGRLMVAGMTISFPTGIGDIINLSTYAAQTGWTDLGATKGGITITRNNTEEVFDVDQITGEIDSRPVDWEQTIATNLAEATLQRANVAWETGAVQTSGGVETVGVGNPTLYTKRMLAVVFKKDDDKLRAHVFRKVQRSAAESAIVYNKTGDQITFPVSWRALADTSIVDVQTRVQVIFNQV